MNVAASSGVADITGYAIPLDRVLRIAGKVLNGVESASVSFGYDAFLGVQLSTGSTAATIAGVLDGGAPDSAGLEAGDVVTALSGVAITSADGLSETVRAHEPGEEVTVSWTDASGASRSAEVTLGRAPVA